MQLFPKLIVILILISFQPSLASPPTLAEKDLAIVLGTALKPGIKFSDRDTLFPGEWYKTILKSYQETSVGPALAQENNDAQWQLMSIRVVPCLPLVLSRSAEPNTFCYPQLRLIWQPIVSSIKLWGRWFQDYGDDRAIHALYDIDPYLHLPPKDALRLARLKHQIKKAAEDHPGKPPLPPTQSQEFVAFRNLVTRAYLDETHALRDPELDPEEYQDHGFRPEVLILDGSKLRQRILDFLAHYASPKAMTDITSFSLPKGREPAHIDEWVMLSFSTDAKGGIKPKDVAIHHSHTGELIGKLPAFHRASQLRDGGVLYQQETESLRRQVFLYAGSQHDELKMRIMDPNQTMIPNTSCSSCHRFNSMRFNFHNLSKFGTDPVEVTERVRRDVAYDLHWFKTLGNPTAK